jgi:hypothetical protein
VESLSTVPQRSDESAFQAECRGFDPRLPLHAHLSCSERHDNWTNGPIVDPRMCLRPVLQRSPDTLLAAHGMTASWSRSLENSRQEILMVPVLEAVLPPTLLTVYVYVYVPALAYVWAGAKTE